MDKNTIKSFQDNWVIITKTDGTTHKGYIDNVGITQNKDSIVLANKVPLPGHDFRGRKILMTNIQNIDLGSPGDTNIPDESN